MKDQIRLIKETSVHVFFNIIVNLFEQLLLVPDVRPTKPTEY